MYRRENRQNEIEIFMEDVELIMGNDYGKLPVFLQSAFCAKCSGSVTIMNYKIYLDDRQDIIFEGICSTCKGPVSRYIETGGSPATENIARHIRAVKLQFVTKSRNE
jgi:hypothetical protein